MCRMLGMIGTPPLPIQDAFDAFYPLCAKGCVNKGMEPGHRDGWGASGFQDSRVVYFERRAEPADTCQSEYKHAAERALKSHSPVVIVHFRKASGAPPGIANTHPFHFRDWVFAHNGTIYGAMASINLNETKPQGETDSELFFLWIWEQIHAAEDPTAALAELLRKSRDNLVFSSLNFLLSDGKQLWAYRDYGEKRLGKDETVMDREKYYTLYTAQSGKSALVCSEPLPALSKRWQPLGQRTLATFTVGNPLPQTIAV